MQSVGITTHLRDLWDDVSADNIIDLREQQDLETLIFAADDAVRLSLTILKVGDGSRDTRQRLREHERLHGPIDLERARRQRRPIDLGKVRNARRRRDASPDSVA